MKPYAYLRVSQATKPMLRNAVDGARYVMTWPDIGRQLVIETDGLGFYRITDEPTVSGTIRKIASGTLAQES
jgi:hypothetical protein